MLDDGFDDAHDLQGHGRHHLCDVPAGIRGRASITTVTWCGQTGTAGQLPLRHLGNGTRLPRGVCEWCSMESTSLWQLTMCPSSLPLHTEAHPTRNMRTFLTVFVTRDHRYSKNTNIDNRRKVDPCAWHDIMSCWSGKIQIK